MTSEENKRRFVRMDLEDIPTTITREDGSTFEALCKNLSGMGMLIESSEELTEGENLSAQIKTQRNELSVEASVARIQENEDAPTLYGLTIISIQ